MLHEFTTLPPRSRPANAGAVLSLVLHAALVAPYLISRAPDEERTDPIDQLVVFLVPPDREGGRAAPGPGVSWSGLQGTGGAVKEPLPRDEHPEEKLEVGTLGKTEPDSAQPVGAPETAEEALSQLEVDSMVTRDPSSAAPEYPPKLLAKNMEGSTFVHYVVDTSGRVDTTTIKVVRTTHEDFAKSVRDALSQMKFRPAIQGSKKVRQWVEQNFSFRILTPKPPPADTR